MSKKTDKIISSSKGVLLVEAIAKKGIAKFTQYETYVALVENETEADILRNYNRMERVDSINDVNRETPTPSAVRALGKIAKTGDAETQAFIEKETQRIIKEAVERASKVASATK